MTCDERPLGDSRMLVRCSGTFQLEDAWRLAAQFARTSGPLRLHLDLAGCSAVDVDGLALLCRSLAPAASEISIFGLARPDLRALHDLGVFLDGSVVIGHGAA